MGTKVLVGGSTVSAPQLQDFFRQIADGSINGRTFQRFLDHQDPFDIEAVVIDWKAVYKVMGMESEFGSATGRIPTPFETRFWDVLVIQGVTPNKVVKALRDLEVVVSLYTDDLDKDISTNDRDPVINSYRVLFNRAIEADQTLKHMSAEMLTDKKIKSITLLERLLLGLGYFIATGNHLDSENITLCSGSRLSVGRVPGVYWGKVSRVVYVNWYHKSVHDSRLRSRAVF